MRKLIFILVLTLAAASAFAQTPCASHYYNACNYIYNGSFAYGMTSWQFAPYGNFSTSNTDTICNSLKQFEKSTGAYGYANLLQEFTTDASFGSSFSLQYTWQLENSHNNTGNRIEIDLYNVTDNTWEVLDRLNGGAGDLWCDSRQLPSVYRPQWLGKQLRIYIYQNYATSDTVSKLTGVSFWQQH